MAWPETLQVALKEWASVCDSLERGRQIVLLRKGGIYEAAGEFQVEHRQFLLFPTYLHQTRKMVKEEDQWGVQTAIKEPDWIRLATVGVVTDIVQLQSRRQMDAIDEEHIWSGPLIDMRFSYRPENPLYLLVVRAHRMNPAKTIENAVGYAGCKSWVPLEDEIPVSGAKPVLEDEAFEERRKEILERVSAAAVA